MVKMHGRDQSQKRNKNRDQVWKAFKLAELTALDQGRWFVTVADFKKQLKLSRPTIYKILEDLKNHGQISRVERGKYSSKQSELVKKITKGLLKRDYHEEAISVRERDRSIFIYEDDLELLSLPYRRVQDEIKSLEKNKLKGIVYVRKLARLYGLKAWIENQARKEFTPLSNLIKDATHISILSDSFIHPFPKSDHQLPGDETKKAVGVFLDGLRDEIWKMLLLYAIHPNFSLDHSALAIVITFDPHDAMSANERNALKDHLASIDHSGFGEFFLDVLRKQPYWGLKP
jgi:DNA-binding transcriptional ArsR family regulator